MDWLLDNKLAILNIVTYIIAIASVIVKLTPTDKDDLLLSKILQLLSLHKKQ